MRGSGLIKLLALLLIPVVLLTSCGDLNREWVGEGNIPEDDKEVGRFTAAEDIIADFSLGEPYGFWARNDRGNGPPFNCSFMRSNAVVADGLLTLSLTKGQQGYIGAEYRTWMTYSYGYYSVKMKAAKCSGVVSSFFTYTGHPWDEIDIEFLGDDTTRVQFNYYTSGKGGNEYYYELGFDASEDFHEYGFDWQPDSITWYVDGESVYRAEVSIPSTAGHIMMNIWNVADSHASWAGSFDPDGVPVTAEYKWIGYKSAN